MANRNKTKIGEYDLWRVLDGVSLIVNLFIELPNEPARDRRGGYFTVIDRSTEQVITITRIGNPEERAANEYLDFSQEKADRLIAFEDHLSSWQSRDPKNGKWGGAIKTEDFILSFSGLPELGDETAMLLTAYHFEWLTISQIVEIAKISNNPHVTPLLERLQPR